MKLTCCLMGSSQLLLQCGQLLLKKNYLIAAIISEDRVVIAWAKEKGIRYIHSLDSLGDLKFDYLFSIVNTKRLSSKEISLATKASINYHDAPLPCYAGVHATSWAILNHERIHGVTWHKMSSIVDAGDVYKQLCFSIDRKETALSLNIKCYQAAITSFNELIDELTQDKHISYPQDLARRTYYSFNQKPPGNGLINWTNTAEIIDREYRAFQLGTYDNHFCALKILVNKKCFIINKMSLVKPEKAVHLKPGKIISIKNNSIQVACGKGLIAIQDVSYINGYRYANLIEWADTLGLKVGDILATPDLDTQKKLQKLSVELFQYENFWVKEFSCSHLVNLPYSNKIPEKGRNWYKKTVIQTFNNSLSETTLLTIIFTYLHRITGEQHLMIGYMPDHLSLYPSEFFGRFLPFNISIDNNVSFKELFYIVEKQLETIKRKKIYLKDISLRYLSLKNIGIITDYFPIIFNVANGKKIIEPITYKHQPQMIITFYPDKRTYLLELNLVGGRYTNKTVARIKDHLQQLAQAAIIQPSLPIYKLSLLTNSEVDWFLKHRGTCDLKSSWIKKSILQIFKEISYKYPHKIAIECGDSHLSYSELDEKSSQIAYFLLKNKSSSQAKIAIYLTRSLEAIIAMLAIIKAGGAYIPIDPNLPSLRIYYILKDADISIILTITKNIKKLEKIISKSLKKPSLIDMLQIMHLSQSYKEKHKIQSGYKNNLAYILYTSGSTGQPKGVAITQRGIIRLVKHQSYFTPNHKDTVLHIANLSFDMSMVEIWSALLNGAKIIIPQNKTLSSISIVKSFKIENSIIFLTPMLFKQIINLDASAFDKAKHLILGGEIVDPIPVQKLLERKKNLNLKIKIINGYGPTENTIASTYYLIKTINSTQEPIPIGRPVAGTTAYVLDKHQNFVPIGVTGELYLGGLGLSQGYLNKPELNAKNFIKNPYAELGDSTLYRTGDLVKWQEDGNIDYIGRVDFQVKLRGYRIELGEIISTLNLLPEVQESIVLLDEKKQCLAAYLKVNFDLSNKAKQSSLLKYVWAALEKALPNYMIPTYLHLLSDFPLTVNRKVDRNALLSLNNQGKKIISYEDTPHSKIEKKLTAYFQKVLDIEKIGIQDNFFKLGGNSLSALELLAKINDSFNTQLTLNYIFDYPTIKELASCIEKKPLNKQKHVISKLPEGKSIPLSSHQEPIWLFEQLNPSTPLYNIPILIELKGNLNKQALQKALSALIDRQTALRTHFLLQKNQVKQNILFSKNIKPIECITKPNGDVMKLIRKLACSPFKMVDNLQPLMKAFLITIKKNDYKLLIIFHHLIVDFSSLEIFFREISLLYNAYIDKKPSPLGCLPTQYQDYSHWQQLNLAKKSKKTLRYWQKQLINAPHISSLTTDFPRPPIQRYKGKVWTLELPKSLLTSFYTLASENGTTAFTLLLSVFYILLHHYLQQDDIVIGVPISEKNIKATENMMGLFVSMLPIRLSLDPSENFMRISNRVKQIMMEAYLHQNVSLQSLVQHLKISTSLDHNPLFQISFNFIKSAYSSLSFTGLTSSSKLLDTNTAKFDLSLDLIEEETLLSAKFEYNTDLFTSHTIRQLGSSFYFVAHKILSSLQLPIKELPVLNQKNLRKILVNWNNTTKNYPTNKLLHQLVEEQANKTPHAIAICTENKTMSYQELNKEANNIAWHLIQQGISSEKFIIISMERSIEMTISILAILKAGGGYVPVEPNYPTARFHKIIAEVEPVLILTQSQFAEGLSIYHVSVININNINSTHENSLNPQPTLNLDHPLSIIYTSGSTGQPKGVINLHRGALNHLHWMRETYDVKSNDCVLQKTAYMFDASFGEMFLPLISGACLVIPAPDEHKDIYRIIELINLYQITIVQFIPSQLALFVEAINQGECTTLKHIICGGETLNLSLYQQFLNKCNAKLHNLYGTTEASDDTTHWLCHKTKIYKHVPIGKPIANTQCFVLNKNLCPVPIGVPGELYVGGVGLARAYLKQPLITQRKFIANPFKNLKDTAPRLYKTGDIVKWLPTGELAFIGREDHQIKMRGFRIEINEIEAAIIRHPGIKQAIVISKEINSVPCLKAYVIAQSGVKISVTDLKAFLMKELPFYMVPTEIITLPSFPLTSTGKPDRVALASFHKEVNSSIAGDMQPTTKTEKKLFEIWLLLLKQESISLTDNFFNLGGNSLLAARMMIYIKQEFNIKLSLSCLFNNPTIYELAQFIDNSPELSEPARLIEIIPPELKNIKNNLLSKFPAFFFVHPIGGSVFCYRQLAQALITPSSANLSYHPFFAFEAKGLHKDERPIENIQEMARQYLMELRKVQPAGPYIIGGWSFGGIVATEMVHQLEAKNEVVIALILIDSSAYIKDIKKINHISNQEIINLYESMFNIKISSKTKSQNRELVSYIERGSVGNLEDYNEHELKQIIKIAKANIKALQHFKLPILKSNIALIKAENTLHTSFDSGWKKYTLSQLFVHTIADANHWSILETEFATKLAKIIKKFLKLFNNKTS